MADNHEEAANVTAFDALYTTNQIQKLKVLLPYIEPSMQKNMAVYIKYMELQYTMHYVCLLYTSEGRLYQAAWPEFEEAKTVESTVEIAVQINGKTRATLMIGKDDPKDTVIAKAKETVADKLTGTIVKEIYVPGRIVNIVQK